MRLYPTDEEIKTSEINKALKLKIANRSCRMSTDTAKWFFEKENYIVEVNEGVPWSAIAEQM